MKQYTIKPEYADRWTNLIEDENKPVTDDDIRTLAREWDTTVDELLEQVDEIDEPERRWFLIDDVRGDRYETPMKATSRADALVELIDTWDRIADYDRKARHMYAIHAVQLPDGYPDYETEDDDITLTLRDISVDNGGEYYAYDEIDAIIDGDEILEDGILWETIVNYMDDDTRELVHAAYAPCTCEQFLRAYLMIAPASLIVG